MEVPAFVFGVLPVALYALDNYHRCLGPVKDYCNYECTLKRISSHIFLQQAQLDATMDCLGLTKPTSEAQLRARLGEVYPEKCEEFMYILERMGKVLEGMMRDLDVDKSQYLEDGKPKISDTLSNRADWEWRRVKRSFGEKKREALIDELDFWNRGLRAIVEAKREVPFPEERDPSTSKSIQARPTPQQCDNVRKDISLVYEAFNEVGWACDCPEHRAMVRLAWHVGVTATSAKVELSFPQLHSPKSWQLISVNLERDQQVSTKSAIPDPLSPRLSPRLSPQPSPRLSPRSLPAKLKSKIQLPRFWPRQEKRPGGTEKGPAAVDEYAQVDALPAASLAVPSTTPAPLPRPEISCICRFINDTQDTKHGVIRLQREAGGDPVAVSFSKGGAADAGSEAAVLASLLKSSKGQQPGIAELSRKHRLEIAAAAAWAALYLCDTPWLGADWGGKDDMKIFLSAEGSIRLGAGVRAVYPSISHVFKSASSSQESAICSAGVPPATAAASFQSGQIRNRALFTLGVLLLELSLGKTFEHIRQKAGRQTRADGGPSPPEVLAAPLGDYEIATGLIDRVYLQEGAMYGDALQRCLRCEFPGRDSTKNFQHQSFRKDFFSGVVEPLQTTFESCIA